MGPELASPSQVGVNLDIFQIRRAMYEVLQVLARPVTILRLPAFPPFPILPVKVDHLLNQALSNA